MAGKSLNKTQLIGNLRADPEIRYTATGMAVATMNVATNERRKVSGTENEYTEETEWHRVVAFGRTAEIAGEFLFKGRQVYIEGRLQTRSWDDDKGIKRYTTEVVVRDLILLGSKDGGSQSGGGIPHPVEGYEPSHTGTTGAVEAAPTF